MNANSRHIQYSTVQYLCLSVLQENKHTLVTNVHQRTEKLTFINVKTSWIIILTDTVTTLPALTAVCLYCQ